MKKVKMVLVMWRMKRKQPALKPKHRQKLVVAVAVVAVPELVDQAVAPEPVVLADSAVAHPVEPVVVHAVPVVHADLTVNNSSFSNVGSGGDRHLQQHRHRLRRTLQRSVILMICKPCPQRQGLQLS